MFLKNLIGLPVFVGAKQRGILQGVFLSNKSKSVKYLLCLIQQNGRQNPLTVSVSALERLDDAVVLKQARSTLPKNASLFQLDKPVYTENGEYLGLTRDLELEKLTAIALHTEQSVLPTTSILALGDAVLVKKHEPFPLGQRIPASALVSFSISDSSPLVTKAILKNAIREKRLIAFTLSLPPFNV